MQRKQARGPVPNHRSAEQQYLIDTKCLQKRRGHHHPSKRDRKMGGNSNFPGITRTAIIHRFNARRTPRGNAAGYPRNNGKHQNCHQQRKHAARGVRRPPRHPGAQKQRHQQARDGAQRDAGCDRLKDQPQHMRSQRTQCHANAKLVRPLRHRVAHYAVQTYRGEQQSEQSEGCNSQLSNCSCWNEVCA